MPPILNVMMKENVCRYLRREFNGTDLKK